VVAEQLEAIMCVHGQGNGRKTFEFRSG